MKRILFVLAVGLSFVLSSSAHADFVIDDFSTGGNGAVTVSGATITIGGGGGIGGGMSYNGSGYDLAPSLGEDLEITYDYGPMTIAEAYGAFDPYADSVVNYNFDKITIPYDFGADVADWEMSIFLDGSTTEFAGQGSLNNYNPTFVDPIQLGDASSITFQFSYNGIASFPSGTFGGGGNSLFANPEPASGLMFASVIGLLGMVRRRRA
ncbi:MAG: PEP-CTERM sorting domain-containing protein [Planctomycetota bacterium]